MDPRLVDIVEALLAIVRSGPQDLVWQNTYRDDAQLVEDLCDHTRRLRGGDASRLAELRLALAPTGSLNEIAIATGWADRYVALASRFDECVAGQP